MNNLISLEQLCELHQIEVSFIYSLNELGLVKVIILEEREYLDLCQVAELEKMIRMYYQLNINIEGIDTSMRLLEKIESLQQEVHSLRLRLKRYEDQ